MRGWQEAEGEPEPWEQDCFFSSPNQPEAYLATLAQEWEDADALARERERLTAVWASGRIQRGLYLPEAGDDRAAHSLAAHYRFELFP